MRRTGGSAYNLAQKQNILASDQVYAPDDIRIDIFDKYALNCFLQDQVGLMTCASVSSPL